MTDARPTVDVNLSDLKARKGHICLGGDWGDGSAPLCGCGTSLRDLPDFMDLPPGQQRQFNTAMPPVAPAAVADQYLAESSDAPPAPFTHASGEPCWGCQSCFANVVDDDMLPDDAGNPVDLMAEVNAIEDAGRDVIVRHDAPDMTPAVPVIDPTQPYGPAEVERAILDANRRLELGSKHEANLIAATEQAKIEYELAYARAIERSQGGAADIRKANATLASEREYRAWHEAMAARDAMKAVTHSLRSTVSALQSVGRSIGVSYAAPQGRGR